MVRVTPAAIPAAACRCQLSGLSRTMSAVRPKLPKIIQGGMGAGVSNWRLAKAVSAAGQLGVVAGTALDSILSRRLQKGDVGGHMRRALRAFPIPDVADRILKRFFVPGGKPKKARFLPNWKPTAHLSRNLEDLLVASSFVEVHLAKESHEYPVGINFLEKIQTPTLPALYGALLAGVDYVLMGAGIPRAIPGVLDGLAEGSEVELRIDIKGRDADRVLHSRFDPTTYCGGELPPVKRPAFVAIVSSHVLAAVLARSSGSRVDGFVVEGPTAGGHNAPPRGKAPVGPDGQPSYGEKDEPDIEAIRELGLPFWLAGSYAEPERVADALEQGAAGVQVGTAFAYCEESGLDEKVKRRVLKLSRRGRVRTFTDPVASPTGFPFKVVQLRNTLSEALAYTKRPRTCDLGYLRSAFCRANGLIGWRCPAEPVEDYVAKGGSKEDTIGRKCLCNALTANIGLAQIRGGKREKPLVTSGDDVARIARFLAPGKHSYKAIDVIRYLLPAG